jgi:hypothetical protein
MSRGHLDVLVLWELQAIEYYTLTTHAAFQRKLTTENGTGLTDEGLLSEAGLERCGVGLALESGLNLLNSFVDMFLLAVGNRSRGEAATLNAATLNASRKHWIEEIEKAYGFSPASIPGWEAVEAVRKSVNILKHKGGIDFISEKGGVFATASVQISEELMRTYIKQIREWSLRVTQKAEGRPLKIET